MTIDKVQKPILLRIIFILNALMMILPFVFYYVFTTKDISIGGLDPIYMVYTGVAYILSFIVLVSFILRRNLAGVRIMLIINVLIALPASAYIGMVIAVISMALSFTPKVKAYFSSTGKLSKSIFVLAPVVLTGSMAFGQSNTQHLEKANVVLTVETEIHAPAEKVWDVLGRQFGDIAEWTAFVQSSRALSTDEIPETSFVPAQDAPVPARQSTVENKGIKSELVEVVTMYSDEDRSLKFYGVGLPGFLAYAGDLQRVESLSEDRSKVVFEVEMRLKGVFRLFKGKVKNRFEENLKSLQNDLKVYVESGLASR